MIRKEIKAADILQDYTDPIPAELARHMMSGRCIALVGAGVSQQCISRTRRPLPGWDELLSEVLLWATNARKISSTTSKDLKELIKQGE